MTFSFPQSNRKDLKITPKLADLGFKEIYSIGKMLVLHTETQNIQCKLDCNDLIKTAENYLKKSLDKFTKFSDTDKEIICNEICKIIVDSINQQIKEDQQEKQKELNSTQKILDGINQLREQNPNLTLELWQAELQKKYQNLQDVVYSNMPEIWTGLEFELSILRILDLDDCNLPFVGIILGRPSSYKTVTIGLLKKWIKTFYTDNFTARSFVSHSTAVNSEADLQEIDLLPKIKGKMFLTPELSPMFTAKEEDLQQLLGIVTRIADGQGYSSDSGAHGHRGYDEEIMFTWIGAAVDIPYKVYKILNTLGPRMYFYRMEFKQQTTDELLDYATADQQFGNKLSNVNDALVDYLKWFEICPTMTSENKIPWDWSSDSRDALLYIVRMADLLSYLRCSAVVWETEGSQGSEYAYTISQRENPHRTITHLKNLARGHALLTGRNHITLDDIRIVIKTALDTATIERVSMFSLLVANNGTLTTDQILNSLRVSRPTALRTMAEFKAIGLVNEEDVSADGPGRPSKMMALNPQFSWFLDDELIKKIIPHTTPKNNESESNGNGNGQADKEDLFWHEYQLLEVAERNNPSNYSDADKNTVSGTKLIERLIMTGQFYNGDAKNMIKAMIDAGKLEMVMVNTYKHIGVRDDG
jgi:hypothetical protein